MTYDPNRAREHDDAVYECMTKWLIPRYGAANVRLTSLASRAPNFVITTPGKPRYVEVLTARFNAPSGEHRVVIEQQRWSNIIRYPRLQFYIFVVETQEGARIDEPLILAPRMLREHYRSTFVGNGRRLTRDATFHSFWVPPFWIASAPADLLGRDEWVDPHASARIPRDLPPVQMALDGREVPLRPERRVHMGRAQLDALAFVLYFAPTSGDVGTHLHLVRGFGRCGSYARDRKYARRYSGTYCCAEASTTGSNVLKNLEQHGAIFRDDAGHWHPRRESEWRVV